MGRVFANGQGDRGSISKCCILTFDLAKHAIPKWCTGRKWHIPMVVMRRNRVGGLGWKTCELHDSYFRLMTIKYAIPKIEWAIELLYNSVRTGSQWVGDQRSWRQDMVEKAIIQQKVGPWASGWAALENERHNADGHKSGCQYIAVLFSLQLPLTHKPFK